MTEAEQRLTPEAVREVALRARPVTVDDVERTLAHAAKYFRRIGSMGEAATAQTWLECFQMATGLPCWPPEEILRDGERV